MNDPLATPPPLSDRGGVTDAVRAQILATEHWSLLATRSMAWNEVFSRAAIFFTVLSAATVALALVAQVAAFGQAFRIFALLVLPIVLLVGVSTLIRMAYVNMQDTFLVLGMNRLRHAYLELAPELERYFVTGHNDDRAGFMRTNGMYRVSVSHFFAGTPNIVAAIIAVLVGVLVALIADTLGAPNAVDVVVGIVAALLTIAVFIFVVLNSVSRDRRRINPLFPSTGTGA